jgi:hypothetical protein
MGLESPLPLKKHEVERSESETSQVVGFKSTVTKEVKKSLSDEPFLLVELENKGGLQSTGKVCDPELNKDDITEAVTLRAGMLGLMISSEAPDGSLSIGCQTPRESIFDPFAPRPEEVVCAPKKKAISDSDIVSRRQLNFESGDYPVKRLSFSSDDDDAEEEDQCVVILENMILDLVMQDGFLDQQKITEAAPVDGSTGEICKTPDSKPLLTGIATTCPDAPGPMRPSLKAFQLSPSIRQKIDFDSVSGSVYDG